MEVEMSNALEPQRQRLLSLAKRLHGNRGLSPRPDLAPDQLVEGALARALRSRLAFKGTTTRELEAWLDTLLETHLEEKWNDAVVLYRNMLEGYARVRWRAWGLSGRRGEPGDLINDTWIKAEKSRGSFRGSSEGEYVVWLQTILEHQARDQFAHEHAQKRDADREASARADILNSSARVEKAFLHANQSTPSLRARREELVGRVYAEINGLSSPHREIVALTLQARTRAQIAEELGLPLVAVQRMITEALETLSARLKDMQGGLR